MAKVAVKRKSTFIDMTPMVDLAFLLITFFMLTVKFVPPESVEVSMPSSIATTAQPPKNLMTILISPEGRVFFGVSNPDDRVAVLRRMGKEYGYTFTPEQEYQFRLMNDVGVDIKTLGQFLDLPPEKRKDVLKTTQGVPMDSTNNQLDKWVINARYATNDGLSLVVKADQKTPYSVIRDVIKTLKKQKLNRFNLITTQEADPRPGRAASSSQEEK
ncbi:MAG: biopolymer transporter ExbD [Bacteroidia bacterium]|nr:biopolymer transporter ExbD [Bacteroidia bacterium]MDW8334637.1 biopolymer transporter ExbD [Bacteroidia bacterium]